MCVTFQMHDSVTADLGSFCQPDAVIPDDLIHCGSCEGRCGNPEATRSGLLQCNCDQLCLLYGDCCRDFQAHCSEEFINAQGVIARFPNQHGRQNFKCRQDVLTMATCLDGSPCQYSETLNDDVNTFVPMYDITKDIHYVSGYCAVCNGAVNVIPWDVSLKCIRTTRLSLFSTDVPNMNKQIDEVNSTESFNQIRQSTSCSLQLTGLTLMKGRKCESSVISSCSNNNCENQELIEKCESSTVLEYTYLGSIKQPFRNPYCALCSESTSYRIEDLGCSSKPCFSCRPGIYPQPNLETFSLTVVFDFDPRRGLAIGEHAPLDCDPGEIYHPEEGVCRAIMCPTGLKLEGNTCVPDVSAIVVTLSGTIKNTETNDTENVAEKNKELLHSKLILVFTKTLQANFIDANQLHISILFNFDGNILETSITLNCYCDYSSVVQFSNNSRDMDIDVGFRRRLVKEVTETVIGYMTSQGVMLSRISTEFVVEKQNASFSAKETECTWLVYESQETELENDNIKIKTTGKIYGPGAFEVLNDSVIVCVTGLTESSKGAIPFALGVVTVVCVGISILCLLIRISLQFCITIFGTRPGRIHFHLNLALFVGFIFLIVGPFVSDITFGCIFSAVVLYYGFLAAFTWMNVIAVDTWLAFRPSSTFAKSADRDKSLWRHVVISWGFPLVFASIAVGVDYSEAKNTYKPNFGGLRCWFTQRIALMIYFGLPIVISIVLNICFYILTALNLRRAFKDRKSRKTQQNEHHFLVYVRLFVLMGFTWIFGFLSAFTDEVAIDFVFVILTSLQGVFLFVSFVCNKRVFNELKKKTKTGSTTNIKQSIDTPLTKRGHFSRCF